MAVRFKSDSGASAVSPSRSPSLLTDSSHSLLHLPPSAFSLTLEQSMLRRGLMLFRTQRMDGDFVMMLLAQMHNASLMGFIVQGLDGVLRDLWCRLGVDRGR
jgi:hypothetical protein